MNKGKLIVLDGLDGSGKETQTKRLIEYLKKNNKKVRTLDFPRYEENFFGSFIKSCLKGEHGDFVNTDPYIASLIYASDRFESKEKLKKWLKDGFVIVLDRYVSANQIHQGGKIKNLKEREKFLNWQEKMEYDIFGLPIPDLIVYLDVSVNISQKLLHLTDKEKDVVELNLNYQKNSRESALYLEKKKSNWEKVNCMEEGKLKSIDEIHKEIVKICKKIRIL